MKVRVRSDAKTKGFYSLLYPNGQVFEIAHEPGVPLPDYLEPASEAQPEPDIFAGRPIEQINRIGDIGRD